MSSKPVYPKIHGYELTQQIGGGGFSTVYRATNYETSEVAACKVISITSDMTSAERKVLNKEMHVHSIMKHPNVLEFYKAIIVEENNTQGYYPAFYFLLELAAGGDLFDKIAPEIGVEPDIAQHYFKQLAAGLEYIHSVGVCHRDLKPENILLDAGGRLKISDFGLCAVYKLDEGGKMKTRLLSENCGSKPYVAPELGTGKPYEAEPIDVWGLGVILFTMLSGNTPWDEPSGASPEYLSYISGDCFAYEPWNTFDRDVLELITGMLTPEPAMRMTLRDVIHHPWMMRENLLTQRGPAHVAEALTASLRREGDLDIATPNLAMVTRIDRDGDQIMLTAVPHSQFTQTLMLFSQTQVGRRYTPVLTRFYTSILPSLLLPLIEEALTDQKIKYKKLEPKRDGEMTRLRIRVGGFDKRKLVFKGTIELEEFEHDDFHGTFCVMNREKGNPISWRQVWKSLIVSPVVEPHVLRKR